MAVEDPRSQRKEEEKELESLRPESATLAEESMRTEEIVDQVDAQGRTRLLRETRSTRERRRELQEDEQEIAVEEEDVRKYNYRGELRLPL